ncbi:hypothetical protein PN442_19395, partial [Dolichospermum circinale CS-547]|nr:hypothetical protein [Dolichospermum circinale CS-547]
QLSVGAKHLEDKLSVIAKNSSPNASPVQLSVVKKKREERRKKKEEVLIVSSQLLNTQCKI